MANNAAIIGAQEADIVHMGRMFAGVDSVTSLGSLVAGVTCQRTSFTPADAFFIPLCIRMAVVRRAAAVAVAGCIGRHLVIGAAVCVEHHLDVVVEMGHQGTVAAITIVAGGAVVSIIANVAGVGTAADYCSVTLLAAMATVACKNSRNPPGDSLVAVRFANPTVGLNITVAIDVVAITVRGYAGERRRGKPLVALIGGG